MKSVQTPLVLLILGCLAGSGSALAQESKYTWRVRDPQGRVVRELETTYDSSGGERWRWRMDYFYGNGILLASRGDGGSPELNKVAYHVDHLGTPRVLTGANGQLLTRHTYHPFGEEIFQGMTDDIALKFTGHERDLEDLDYMRARFYRPSFSRFLSPDPSGEGWNQYAYVGNNPIGNFDPTGMRRKNAAELATGAQDFLRTIGDRAVDDGARHGAFEAVVMSVLIETPFDLVAGAFDVFKLGSGTGDAIDAFSHGEVGRGFVGLGSDAMRGLSMYSAGTSGSFGAAAADLILPVGGLGTSARRAEEVADVIAGLRITRRFDEDVFSYGNQYTNLKKTGDRFFISGVAADGKRFGFRISAAEADEYALLQSLWMKLRDIEDGLDVSKKEILDLLGAGLKAVNAGNSEKEQ